jgi:peroxiredoxin
MTSRGQPDPTFDFPAGLPRPVDDGACAHLVGARVPALALPSTSGREVELGALGPGRTVLYVYPMTGVPGRKLPDGWDAIPGARGCTPQACAFRDHHAELRASGVAVHGVSAQDTAEQRGAMERLHLPFELLSDAELRLARALGLPTFIVDGRTFLRRVTLIVRDGVVEHVFYPVFPPDRNAAEVTAWVDSQPLPRGLSLGPGGPGPS